MYYKEISIKINDLLLDPNNPRFSLYQEDKIPESQIEAKQEETFNKMCDSRIFAVNELIDAIKSDGFNPVAKIFVRKIGSKYLVLEGNRRVSAVKYLLMKHKEGRTSDILPDHILKSMIELGVNDLTGLSEGQRLRIIAIIHLGGAKEWKPLPAAFSIYCEYMRVLGKDSKKDIDKFVKNTNNFVYKPAIARKVKDQFTISLAQVRNGVKVYRTHRQLIELTHNDPRVADENNYSMIGDVIKDKTLNKYFAYNDDRGVFEDEGAENFLDLCLIGNDSTERVITAPASGESSLRDFSNILGSPSAKPEDEKRVVKDRTDASKVWASVKSREDSENLHAALKQVFEILKRVEFGMVDVAAGLSSAEKKIIKDIEDKLKQFKKASE